MLVFLLSLAGIPPTAGFIGSIFISLADPDRALRASRDRVLYVAVAIYYYFRIVRACSPKRSFLRGTASSFGVRVALALTGLATL
jgi:NADH-quinone oxidoreductase subunit N